MQHIVEWIKRILRVLLNVERDAQSEHNSGKGIAADARYERVETLLNASERRLFHELITIVGPSGFVLAKVRMEDVVRPSRDQHSRVQYAARSRVKSRHFDFVVIDARGVPAIAIELDGPDHARRATRESDRFKDDACASARLPLLRVPVGYRESQLAPKIRQAIGAPS